MWLFNIIHWSMELLLKNLKESYFTDGIAFLLAITGLIISIRGTKIHHKMNLFILYFFSYILLKLSFYFEDFISYSFYINFWRDLTSYLDFLFTILEYFIFSIYFNRIFFSLKDRRINLIISIVFLIIAIAILIFDLMRFAMLRTQAIQNLFSVQALCLLVPCCLYYMQLFKRNIEVNLINESSFWVITGLSFFMLCTLPFSLIMTHIMNSNPALFFNLFSIFLIFYILLFSMIIRAFFCKPVKEANV